MKTPPFESLCTNLPSPKIFRQDQDSHALSIFAALKSQPPPRVAVRATSYSSTGVNSPLISVAEKNILWSEFIFSSATVV